MKDKLRELAERWKGAGCRNGSSHECADELLSILDAEGDGGAVELEYPEFHAQGMGCGLEDRGITDRYEAMRYGFDEALDQMARIIENAGPLYNHPARSGVVSDEDVSVVAKMIANRVGNGMREKYEELAKQIAEHFAAITQEKQS